MREIWNRWLKIPVTLYCVLYTAITILNSVLYLANGIYEDPSGNWHELDRAMIMFIGIAAYVLATKVPIKNLLIRAIVVYIPTLALVWGYVWLVGLREPLAASAYQDITFNYTGLFLIVFLIVAVRQMTKKRKNQSM